MNIDDFLKFEAGPEMDTLIAEIMEQKPANVTIRDLRCQHRDWIYSDYRAQSPGGWWEAQIGTDANLGPSGRFIKEFDNNFAEWKPAKKPSEEIASAWEVAEWLRTYCMMDFFIGYSDNQKGYCAVWRKKAEVIASETFGEIAPLAICRAAYIAVKVQS